MKLLLLTFCYCLLFLVAHSQVVLDNDATPGRSVGVQPMDNNFSLKAGESKEFKLYISNKTDKKMSFKVYANDWHRDSVGAHVYSAPGTQPHSCSNWISFDKKFITVDTTTVGVVTVKLQIPDSAAAANEMKWAMIFIQSVEEAKAPEITKEMKSQIQPSLRFGIHVNQTPPNLATEKDFKLISFTPMPANKSVFRILGENTGKIQLTCKSYIELSSIKDGKKNRLPTLEVPVFPGQIRYFDFTLPSDLAKGKYTMVGVVDAGSDLDLLAAQMTINIE